MHRFNIFILLLSLYSCAGYVEKLHQQMDKENLKRGRSLQSLPGASDERSVVGSDSSKRYIADDFQDNDANQSLWVGNGNDAFFSNGGKRKEKGDIITIFVNAKLKNQIQAELDQIYQKIESDETSETTTAPAEKTDATDTETVHDKITSVVTKEVRENHLFILGRKELIYKGNKHLVEISALINRKDISLDDTIKSTKILQTNIKVLR